MLYSLKSSVCLAAAFLLFYLLLRHETFHHIKRLVLLTMIAASFVAPILTIRVKSAGTDNPHLQVGPVSPQITRMLDGESVFARISEPVNYRKPVINQVVLLYFAGVAFQLAFLIYSFVRILLFLRSSRKTVFQGRKIWLVREKQSPFCFGNRIVISEKDFVEHGPQIILHEQVHLKGWHSLDLIIAETVLLVTWYNPFSWLLMHELKQVHEFEADHNVILQGVNSADYQLLLVRNVAGEPRFKLANQFRQSNIKSRIHMMNKRKSSPGSLLKLLVFLPLIALMVQLFAQKVSDPVKDEPLAKDHGKYLVLKPDQLKLLGLEVNQSGLFYKNFREGKPDKGMLCLYFTNEMYSTSIILKKGEKLPGHSEPVRILKNLQTTGFDFYPVVVAGFNGSRTLEIHAPSGNPEQKLLPVQVNMAELNLGKRADTLLFWFLPTESLKKILSPLVNAEDYVQLCPPDPRDAR